MNDRFHFVKFDHDNDRLYVDKDLFKEALGLCLAEIAEENAKIAQEKKAQADLEEQAICEAVKNLNLEELEIWKKKYNDWEVFCENMPCLNLSSKRYRTYESRRCELMGNTTTISYVDSEPCATVINDDIDIKVNK